MGSPEINLVKQLHTEKLIKKYGSISVTVIKHSDNLRLSELKDNNGILRTYAITIFSETPYSNKLMTIHNEIKNGASIGQTIKDFGCDIAKKTVANFIISTPVFFNDNKKFTCCQLSEIYCRIDDHYEFYAGICEIFCPSFKVPNSINKYENASICAKVKNVLARGKISPNDIILIK